MGSLPIQRHPHCERHRCSVCLEDADALTDYIFERTGLTPRFHDILGEYRSWLDKHEIPAEASTGWPTPQVYERTNIEAFINHLIDEDR